MCAGMSATLPIETRPFGDGAGLLARVALGGGGFGGVGSAPEFFGQGLDDAAAAAVMDRAWELGITHFDTADAYGGGRSERAIGAWIRSRGVHPTLTTKTFNPMAAGADSGLAPERVRRQLQSSLERLGVDSVELYLAHDHDPRVGASELAETFEGLRGEGLIGRWGVSNFDAAQLEDVLAAGAPAAIQNGHSLLERRDEDGVLPLCERARVAYIAFSPLCGGWLTGKYRRGAGYPAGSRMTQRPEPYLELADDGTFTALEGLERVAGELGMSMAGTALAWLLADPRVAQVVVGPSRPEHLQPVREAIEHPLAAATRGRLSELFDGVGT